MTRGLIVGAIIFALAISAHSQRATPEASAMDLAANVVDVGTKALVKDDDGPNWKELENRLDKLYDNSRKEADEAVVILMSFYLGEHNGEELHENLLSRGPRMIPIIERYLNEEPAALLARYPKRVHLERATTVMFLKEALEILKVQAGARHISSTSVETAPYQEQSEDCRLKLVREPAFRFGDDLIQKGESYSGPPVIRADIDENGELRGIQLLSSSGIKRLDSLLVDYVHQWKYAQRKNCPLARSNIAVTINWADPN